MTEEILVLLASLSVDPFFTLPYPIHGCTKWKVSGSSDAILLKKSIPHSDGVAWSITIASQCFTVILSRDLHTLLSLTKTEQEKETSSIDVDSWYTAIHPHDENHKKQCLKGSLSHTTPLGTFSCAEAVFQDIQGNHFRWYLCDDVIGGILEYEIIFADKQHSLCFTLINEYTQS